MEVTLFKDFRDGDFERPRTVYSKNRVIKLVNKNELYFMSSRIYENEPNEICSHFNEKGPEGERCSLTEVFEFPAINDRFSFNYFSPLAISHIPINTVARYINHTQPYETALP